MSATDAADVDASDDGSTDGSGAVDATNVYWANSLGTVDKIGLGGGVGSFVATMQSSPQGIALNATSVFWTDVMAGTVTKAVK